MSDVAAERSAVGRTAIAYGERPHVRSVNVAAAPTELGTGRDAARSGIAKTPVDRAVEVRAPGERSTGLGSGLVGDTIGSRRHHGGDDQAVYAYAREDLDHFAALLGQELADGVFGENLTTVGVDASGAVLGERWRVGTGPLLAVRGPRIPCRNFRTWIGVRGWLRTFDRAGLPGAYLAVAEPGAIAAGDPVQIVVRPGHGITVHDLYRAMTSEPDRWPEILARVPDLSAEARRMGAAGTTYGIG